MLDLLLWGSGFDDSIVTPTHGVFNGVKGTCFPNRNNNNCALKAPKEVLKGVSSGGSMGRVQKEILSL